MQMGLSIFCFSFVDIWEALTDVSGVFFNLQIWISIILFPGEGNEALKQKGTKPQLKRICRQSRQ
jgi:hypothetical protein